MVNAFVAVRDLARFDDVKRVQEDAEAVESESGAGQASRPIDELGSVTRSSSKGTVNLNIQLQLPSDASGEVYDKFFEAMKKHGLI